MPKFNCICVDNQGQRVETHYEANSILEVTSFLRNRNLTPISVQKIRSGTFFRQVMSELNNLSVASQIKASEKAIFFRQLGAMLKAGMNLVDCLEDFSSQMSNKVFSSIIGQIKRRIVGGSSFSQALSDYPRIFPPLIKEMITVGEMTGSLDDVISNIASFLESQINLKKNIATASRYPMFMLFFFVVAVGIMIFYLIPIFKGIFLAYGAELPALTRFTMSMSDFFIKNLVYEVIFIVGIGFLGFGSAGTRKGRANLDKIKLKLPIIARFIHDTLLARICRALGILLQSGVSLVVALEQTAAISDNAVAEKAIREMREKIIQGSTLGKEMRKQSFFPSLVTGMVHTGEESGTLSDILPQIADFYDREIDYKIKDLGATLEPILIIGLGAIAAFFVLAMYLPIFQLGGAM